MGGPPRNFGHTVVHVASLDFFDDVLLLEPLAQHIMITKITNLKRDISGPFSPWLVKVGPSTFQPLG